MLGADTNDTWLDFVVEMRPHLRDLRAGLRDARGAADAGQIQAWAQASHLVKGAAALVGLTGLSHAAYYQEEALRAAADGSRPWTPALIAGLRTNVERLEEYLFALIEERPLDDEEFLEERRAAFARLDAQAETASEALAPEAVIADAMATVEREAAMLNLPPEAALETETETAADRAFALGLRLEPLFRWAETSLEESHRAPQDAAARRGLAEAFGALATAATAANDGWTSGVCASLAAVWRDPAPAEADPQWLAAAALDALEHRLFGARDAGLEEALDIALAGRFAASLPLPHETASWLAAELAREAADEPAPLAAAAEPVVEMPAPAPAERFAAEAEAPLTAAPFAEPAFDPPMVVTQLQVFADENPERWEVPLPTSTPELALEPVAPPVEVAEWDALDPELRDAWTEEATARAERLHGVLTTLAAAHNEENLLAAAADYDAFRAVATGAEMPKTAAWAAQLSAAAFGAAEAPGESRGLAPALSNGLELLLDLALGAVHPDDEAVRTAAAVAALEAPPAAERPPVVAEARPGSDTLKLQLPDDLLDIYTEEATNLLACMRQAAAAPVDDRAALHELRAAAHTLKGAAGAVGFGASSGAAGGIETLLDRVLDDGRPYAAADAAAVAEAVALLDDMAAARRSYPERCANLQTRFEALLRTPTANEPAFVEAVMEAPVVAAVEASVEEYAAPAFVEAVMEVVAEAPAEEYAEPVFVEAVMEVVAEAPAEEYSAPVFVEAVAEAPAFVAMAAPAEEHAEPVYIETVVETPAAVVVAAPELVFAAPTVATLAAAEALEPDERAEIAPELLEVFTEEAEDHVRQLRAGLAALERNSADREPLNDIRRSAHTLKGAAGAVGLRNAAQLAHRMEDLLDGLHEGTRTLTPEAVALLYDSTDLLEDLSTGVGSAKSRREALYGRFATLLGAPEQPAAAPVAAPVAADPFASMIDRAPEPALSDALDGDAAKQGPTVRVPLERLDELVRLVSELVINRAAFEQRLAGYARMVNELRTSAGRLRHASSELQVAYEAKSLGGRGLGGPAAPAPNAAGGRSLWAETGGGGGADFDELEFDRYTQFHLLTRAMAEATTDVATTGGELRGLLGDFDALMTRQSRLSRDLQNRLTRVRMVPLANLAPRLRRATRQVAQQLGKLVDLEFSGAHTELDKTVLEEMADPLLHLLRNCVDHGVETPEERRAAGKPERARVFVKAFHRGTQALIQIGDDGRGLDLNKIRATAVRQGLYTVEQAAAAAPAELQALILAPGFSTAAAVSEVSGRGVGMDIVREKVRRLKGTIHIESRPGQGALFTIALPMTLAVVRALLVQAGGRMYAVPMQAVSRILRVDPKNVQQVGGARAFDDNGKLYPLRRLADALGLAPAETAAAAPAAGRDNHPSALLVRTLDRDVAVEVERVLYGREVVVKTLGTHLRRVPGVMGATILGDGSVVPILDTVEMFGPQDAARLAARLPARRAQPAARGQLEVMVVDDSVSVRRVVCNLVKSRGWRPLQARDGLDALEQLRAGARPSVVLLDVEMPRMTGYDLLAHLRGTPEFAGLPVAMITSRSGAKHRQKALDLGADDYVVKPYQDDDLIALVERLAAGGRGAAVPQLLETAAP